MNRRKVLVGVTIMALAGLIVGFGPWSAVGVGANVPFTVHVGTVAPGSEDIQNAYVKVGTASAVKTDIDGDVSFTLPEGATYDLMVWVHSNASGFKYEGTVSITDGGTETVEFARKTLHVSQDTSSAPAVGGADTKVMFGGAYVKIETNTSGDATYYLPKSSLSYSYEVWKESSFRASGSFTANADETVSVKLTLQLIKVLNRSAPPPLGSSDPCAPVEDAYVKVGGIRKTTGGDGIASFWLPSGLYEDSQVWHSTESSFRKEFDLEVSAAAANPEVVYITQVSFEIRNPGDNALVGSSSVKLGIPSPTLRRDTLTGIVSFWLPDGTYKYEAWKESDFRTSVASISVPGPNPTIVPIYKMEIQVQLDGAVPTGVSPASVKIGGLWKVTDGGWKAVFWLPSRSYSLQAKYDYPCRPMLYSTLAVPGSTQEPVVELPLNTTPPIALCQDKTVVIKNCSASVTPSDIDNGSSDDCGPVTLSLSQDSFDCNDVGPNTVTLTATDLDGNSSTCTATVTVVDEENPTISDIVPASGACLCGVEKFASTYKDDNMLWRIGMDIPGVGWFFIHTDPAPFDPPYSILNPGTYSVMWDTTTSPFSGDGSYNIMSVAWDESNRYAHKFYSVSVDNTPLVLAIPPDITVECTESTDPSNTGQATATDAGCCGLGTVTYSDASTQTSDGSCTDFSYTITRTWTATDACGNASSCVQTITVDDTIAPTASNPAPISAQCAAPAPDISVVTDEADNCTAAPVVAFVSDSSDGKSCPETITRTYSVTDDCGNSINVTQTITVDDTIAPTISCPSDATIKCTESSDPSNTGSATATDNCDPNPGISYGDASTQTSNGSCTDSSYTITRTWTATDACGNASSCVQTITVTNVPPTIAALSGAILGEGTEYIEAGGFTAPCASTWTATVDYGDGTGTQPLSLVGKTFSLTHVYADNGDYIVTVTITDACSDSDTGTCLVTVENVAPTVNAGVDQTVDEGDTVILDPARFNDLGTLDTHAATIDWGDGTAVEAGAVSESPFGPPGSTTGMDGTVAGSHVYADNGAYTVAVTVTDDDGASTADTLIVTVENVAPTVDAGVDQTVDEGDTVALDPARFNDLGTLDTHTATIDWGDGTAVEAGAVTESPFGPPGSTTGMDGTVAGSHVYTLPAAAFIGAYGDYTVTVTVTDDDSGSTSDTLVVRVHDVQPPTTAFVGTPTDPDNDPTPLFEWIGSDDHTLVGDLEYSTNLDGAGWSAWSLATSATIGPVAEGAHTFQVRARDLAGNVESTASYTWYVDLTAPRITLTVPADGAEYLQNSTVLADWTASDPESGLAGTTATGPSGDAIDTSSPGSQTFFVEATDLAGNATRVEHEYRVVYTLSATGPAGGGGGVEGREAGTCFLDRCLAGGGGEFNAVPLTAIYDIGETIGISFSITDDAGDPITNALVAATMVQVTLAGDGTESYEIVGVYAGDPLVFSIMSRVPYYADLGSYALAIRTAVPTEGWQLEAGIYDLWLEFNDGTIVKYRIQIVEPTG